MNQFLLEMGVKTLFLAGLKTMPLLILLEDQDTEK